MQTYLSLLSRILEEGVEKSDVVAEVEGAGWRRLVGQRPHLGDSRLGVEMPFGVFGAPAWGDGDDAGAVGAGGFEAGADGVGEVVFGGEEEDGGGGG